MRKQKKFNEKTFSVIYEKSTQNLKQDKNMQNKKNKIKSKQIQTT